MGLRSAEQQQSRSDFVGILFDGRHDDGYKEEAQPNLIGATPL